MEDLNALPLPRLFDELTSDGSLQRLLLAAMDEDFRAPGDVTSDSIIEHDHAGGADLVAREVGVVAGLALGPAALSGAWACSWQALAHDGEACNAGQRLAQIDGSRRRLLAAERTLLNLVGRLSGVATMTRRFVDAVGGTGAVICDTRKTTPGMRSLEKYAVRCGGGVLHRQGLYDAALYKDNHLAGIPDQRLAMQLDRAIRQVRSQHSVRFVEVEVDRIDQLKELLKLDRGLIDFILLDNMASDRLREAVLMRNGQAPWMKLEASGGVNLSTVRAIAETGVDRISVGALTHSAPCLDVGLDMR